VGRVIRAQRTGPSVVPGELYAALSDAAQVRARAQRDADALRGQAHAEGYASGRAEAGKQLFDLARMQAELKQRNEHDMLRAVLLVAAELLGTTLSAEPEKIVRVLAPHLTRMQRAQQLVLRLHPDDASWLEQHQGALAELCQLSQLDGSLELRSDPSLTRGGCCIESNLGELDARVETRLTLLAAALGLPSPERA
jgi:flagellar assembly protein FliH